MSDTAAVTNDTGNATTTTTTATTDAPNPWGELPDNLKAVVANKGWKAPADAAKSYDELFRFVGADKAGRGLVLPDPTKATPEEIAAFRAKAASVAGGIPDNVDGYGITLPEGFPDPEFGKVAGELMLKHRIPKGDAQGLIADFAAQVQAGEVARVTEENKRFETEVAELKSEWGGDYDKKMELAKRGARASGAPTEVQDFIEDFLHAKGQPGAAGVLRWMASLGEAFGEGKFVDGGGDGGNFAVTLDTLMAQRKALYSDKAWADRYWANDPSARNEAKALEDKIAKARHGA
jgi:hypothetical protein